MTSYSTDGTVGPWAFEKLECLRRYLEEYTKILRKQEWCTGFLYIDAFAGAGRAPLRLDDEVDSPLFPETEPVAAGDEDKQQYVDGSPRVALSIPYPFTKYYFIEKDEEKVQNLRLLKQEFFANQIEVLHGSASEELGGIVAKPEHNWKKQRAVALLDPFGMQVDWKTITTLARTKAIEVIVNFPLGMTIHRRLPNNGALSPSHRASLDRYFGSPDWFDAVYEESGGLFGDLPPRKRPDADEKLVKWYQSRLKEAFGFSSSARRIRNRHGTPIYYLIWAGPNKVAAKIINHILQQGEVV